MRIATGLVIDGRVELPREFMADGCRVMVLAPDAADGVRLSAEEERELSEAAEEIRRGEFVTGDELLAELRSFGDS